MKDYGGFGPKAVIDFDLPFLGTPVGNLVLLAPSRGVHVCHPVKQISHKIMKGTKCLGTT